MVETPHIKGLLEDFSKTVIMPGDPLRAKFIAETYLQNYKLITSIRNIFGYTGYYKGKRVTVMSSGMGMPSMGIYCYELYTYLNVENIIRIGSAGSRNPNVNILDIILSTSAYTEGMFAYTYNNENVHEIGASTSLNEKISTKAKELCLPLLIGKTLCSEIFYFRNSDITLKRIPNDVLAIEMEAFALFYTANVLGKQASCLLTISDSEFSKQEISAEDRQTSLTTMIVLALEAAIELGDE